MRIIAGRVADSRGERDSVLITLKDGKIVSLQPWTDDDLMSDVASPARSGGEADPNEVVDARDSLVLPGFIDIHVHGGAGRYVMEGPDRADDALRAIAKHLARFGVTGFLSTTVTGPWDIQRAAIIAASRHRRSPENGTLGAAVLGVHLEGPYINPTKKGAQPGPYILAPSSDDLVAHVGEDLSEIRIVTLAPEIDGALALISFLIRKGIIASIGHTNATYAQVSAAIDAGATHITHCFNAMRAMDSREPGVVGAAFRRPELSAELIWDNIHVHPSNCEALVAAKGAEGVILISDGIPGAGMPDGYQFSLGDLAARVTNGAARLPDGTLAGSLLTLDRAFHNAAGLTLRQRAAMTSRNAAVTLGLGNSKGLISPGYDGDLVILGKSGEVTRTIIAGRNVFSSG